MSEEKKRRRRKSDLEDIAVSVAAAQPEPAPTDSEEEGFIVKRVPWTLRVDGLDVDIPLTGIKLPTFTSGMIDRGDVTIETINVPEIALNSYFRGWLSKPTPRRVQLKVLDTGGNLIETWSMLAVPGAMGFGDLDVQDDSPWVTQIAFSINEVKIEPFHKI